jgi:Flp pilus assembly protein TadG
MKKMMLTPRKTRRERGQSLVELAISLTIILLLLSGAVDFGMALFSYVSIRDAAQEGALFASISPCTDSNADGTCQANEPANIAGIRARVRAASSRPVNLASSTIIPDANITAVVIGGACEGSTVISGVTTSNGIRVTVEYDYPIIMPYIGAIIGGQTIRLRASVTDTILTPRCPP